MLAVESGNSVGSNNALSFAPASAGATNSMILYSDGGVDWLIVGSTVGIVAKVRALLSSFIITLIPSF